MARTDVATRPTPKPLPVAEDAEAERSKLIAQFPRVVKDTVAEVDPRVVEVYQYAKWAIDYWQKQADAAALEIRHQMGSAEKATVDGVPVFSRRQYPVKGYWVEARDNDALYPVAGK